MGLHTESLPDFPWDSLIPARNRAAEYPGAVCDLTIGTPVDDTPELIRTALADASNAHAYPAVIGTDQLRGAIAAWMRRRRGINADVAVLPTIGSKEIVGLLPAIMGLGPGARIGVPEVAYPTYDVGVRLAGATAVFVDTDADPATWPADLDLLWLNSPGNPNGHVLGRDQLREAVAWARRCGVVVASDECYAELCWDTAEAPSILADDVCGQDASGLLMTYSLSKQSNLAGYRAAWLAGDQTLIAPMIELRKHLGFMMPTPVQHAMAVALADDGHVTRQREVYRRRRDTLLAALADAGCENDPASVAGLYLWVRAGNAASWDIVNAFAELGIVVAPGTFYGKAGDGYVRISLTAADATIEEAARRLKRLPDLLS
ncbi:N-succinyldiaminopimelate aminotransferase [Trueperella pyogenes]|uniref:succinyldiaminopimelate transaminase n=1 Tax=Trueperella pyogenes TaxID=1661 RepID=UPI00043AFECB|nr:succinyldiaminopimelate transaminase [Trueperella pyogenes]AHU89484.1 N-succinyldiaminopimelate aminotransferase [Trueperella pyogenes]OQD37718.1 succinyldiaminopimelate transaminase [Trueperella pyogenes]